MTNYDGHLILSEWVGQDGYTNVLRIDQADPFVSIDDVLIVVARNGDNPWISLDEDSKALTIRDDFGMSYTYRLDRHDIDGYWEASWPD